MYMNQSRCKSLHIFIYPLVVTVSNLVGIVVGVNVAGFVLFVVITIVIIVVMGLCVTRSVRASASSSKHSHTAAVTTISTPATTAANTVRVGTQQNANTLTTDAQSYPTDVKETLASPAQPVEIEMQAQQSNYSHQPVITHTTNQEVYPPLQQGGYPPQ